MEASTTPDENCTARSNRATMLTIRRPREDPRPSTPSMIVDETSRRYNRNPIVGGGESGGIGQDRRRSRRTGIRWASTAGSEWGKAAPALEGSEPHGRTTG